MTESVNDANNTKLIALKKFFIFNSKYGSTEGEVKKFTLANLPIPNLVIIANQENSMCLFLGEKQNNVLSSARK